MRAGLVELELQVGPEELMVLEEAVVREETRSVKEQDLLYQRLS